MTRSIAHQTVDGLGGPGSVLVRQRRDHIDLDLLPHELDGTQGAAPEEETVDRAELVRLGRRWDLVRRIPPTRRPATADPPAPVTCA